MMNTKLTKLAKRRPRVAGIASTRTESLRDKEDTVKPSPVPRAESAPETAAESDTAAEPLAGRESTPRRRGRRVAMVVVIVLLLGGLGFLGFRWYQDHALEQARSESLASAQQYANDLATYDHTRIAENFATVAANSTPKFTEQYRKVSDNLTKLIQQYQAVSKPTVLQAGVSEVSTDRAVVMLFLDQNVTNTNAPQGRIDRNRMKVTLLKQDDRWMLDQVDLL